MVRRSRRATTRVTVRYKVEVRRRLAYRIESRQIAVPAQVPRLASDGFPSLASHREAIYSAPLGAIRRAADAYTETLPDSPAPEDKPFDCFICYAIPDEHEVVAPLVALLRARDLKVWAGMDLTIGSPLGRKIDQGLRASRFGVVVLSPAFFAGNGWRRLELDALMGMEAADADPVILPIWHEISAAQVAAESPILAGMLGRSTASHTLQQISDEIAEVARS